MFIEDKFLLWEFGFWMNSFHIYLWFCSLQPRYQWISHHSLQMFCKLDGRTRPQHSCGCSGRVFCVVFEHSILPLMSVFPNCLFKADSSSLSHPLLPLSNFGCLMTTWPYLTNSVDTHVEGILTAARSIQHLRSKFNGKASVFGLTLQGTGRQWVVRSWDPLISRTLVLYVIVGRTLLGPEISRVYRAVLKEARYWHLSG